MKILVVCQHYWPEPYPLTDILEELVKRGHTVHLITDVPNYPMGIMYDDYKKGRRRSEEHNGVKITRTFTIPRRNNAIFRLLNYYSYAISSSIYAKRIKEDYDVVFANQTSPVMMSSAAFAYAKKHDKKVVMYCMDLWPACLAAGGVKESSLIYKFFGIVSKKLYNKADCIMITSQMFQDYLVQQHNVNNEKIKYLPQYAAEQFSDIAVDTQISKAHETINLMFAGNIGVAQSLSTIIKAAKLVGKETKVHWHFVGDGSELENLQALAQKNELTNITFHGRKPIEDMPAYYKMADAMLVTLIADPFISLTLPGKVQTYMAAGKPIIAAANGEIKRVIDAADCGYCVNAGDYKGLANAVELFSNSQNKTNLGNNSKEHYDRYFSKNSFFNRLENEMQKHA